MTKESIAVTTPWGIFGWQIIAVHCKRQINYFMRTLYAYYAIHFSVNNFNIAVIQQLSVNTDTHAPKPPVALDVLSVPYKTWSTRLIVQIII